MEYKTGSKILEAVTTAQHEGFTLDQTIKLIHEAWRVIDNFEGKIDEYIIINYYNEAGGK